MICRYCRQEGNHLKGCPELETGAAKTRAIREFVSGSFSGCILLGMDDNPSDSYKLGYEAGVETFKANPPNC